MQSNLAVNNYYGQGGEVNPNLAKDIDGNIATGTIVAANILDGRMYLNIPDSGQTLIFTDPQYAEIPSDGTSEPKNNYKVVPMEASRITSSVVNPILNHGKAMSDSLLNNDPTITPIITPYSCSINTTIFPDNATIYIDADYIANNLASSGGVRIDKKPNQLIVFNFDSTENLKLSDVHCYINNNKMNNSDLPEHIVYNCASVKNLELAASYGIFLVPQTDSNTVITGSSEGWIITGGTLRQQDYSNEWHLKSDKMKKATECDIGFVKKVDDVAPAK